MWPVGGTCRMLCDPGPLGAAKQSPEGIVLKGAGRQHYIDSANVAVWDRLKKLSPKQANALQQKIFPDWTPPKS